MMQATAEQPMTDEPTSMNCMEVWGGSVATNTMLSRPGMDVWVWSQSKSNKAAGGGDLHLISSCASGRITRMLLAEVCSCGNMFTEISGELRDLMKRNVNSIRQNRAIHRMSEDLNDAALRGGYASTMLSTYFAPTRSFTLCNAGQPPAIRFSASANEWSTVLPDATQSTTRGKPDDELLGVVDPGEYQHSKLKLGVSDLVLVYSNTLTECRDSLGRTIGLSGLVERVHTLDPSRPSELVPTLVKSLRLEHPDNLDNADSTVLLCQATDNAVTWQDNILAPFRLLTSVTDSTRIADVR